MTSTPDNRRSPIKAVVILVAVFGIQAQELDPRNPVYIDFGVDRADVIVTGEFSVTWFHPWFDGWHYSGALYIDEVLYGKPVQERAIPFSWLESYGGTCLICDRLSSLKGKSGIWLLIMKNGEWLITGTAATLCGPLPLDTLNTVTAAIEQKKAKR